MQYNKLLFLLCDHLWSDHHDNIFIDEKFFWLGILAHAARRRAGGAGPAKFPRPENSRNFPPRGPPRGGPPEGPDLAIFALRAQNSSHFGHNFAIFQGGDPWFFSIWAQNLAIYFTFISRIPYFMPPKSMKKSLKKPLTAQLLLKIRKNQWFWPFWLKIL